MTSFVRENYLAGGVWNNARVYDFLLRDLPSDSPRWDAKPDEERFSLREIVAHVLDYDSVSRDRFERIIREDKPELAEWDEGEAARHYEARDPKRELESLLVSRQELGAWLRGLTGEEWERSGVRPKIGEFSVEDGVALVIAHDAYHLEQIVAWLDATA